MRLAYRFGIAFLVVVLVAGGVLVATFDAHRADVDENTELSVVDRAAQSASVLDERLSEQRRTVAVAATNPDLVAHETAQQDQALEAFVSSSAFDGATVVDDTGTVRSFTTTRQPHETEPIVGTDLSEQAYVRAALDGEQYISDPFRAQTGNTIVVISAPLVEDGEVVGTINGAYHLEETGLFDSLAGTDNRDAITVESDSWTLYTTADRFDDTVSHSVSLEVVDWTVTAHRDQAAVDARINRLVLFQIVSAAALLGSIMIFGGWVYRSKIRHIGLLVDRVRALERREYDAGPSLEGPAEWQRIDGALDRLAGTLAHREQMLLVLNRILRHNLRNTLNIIAGRATDLESKLDGDDRESAREIQLVTTELLELADRARMTEDLLDPVGEPVPQTDLAAVVRDRVAEFTTEDDGTNADISVTAPAHAIAACGPEVEAAVDELLANAASHAGPEPTVAVTVETTTDHVRIRIHDDGPGIPDDEAAIITGTRSISQVTHTGGIGLWLVDWIVRRYDGRLLIPSTDSGATDAVDRSDADGSQHEAETSDGATIVLEFPRAPNPESIDETDAGM
ncbi:sensor histidine kinase [Natronorubrum sulfidifaciens]|uniref:histidine kinase n=1 Tax=Natronorubrum sulfidifaciens JCM 14089 TaxID=1230460 RepID=L9WIS0_9EURY|nr:sensor histidine kinase [Natronorubrum sulfidifaciens]ELY48243.1 ATP-binding region ATPase domain-containing protein [Natronorubrum sulfidifaciens JCM 14089]